MRIRKTMTYAALAASILFCCFAAKTAEEKTSYQQQREEAQKQQENGNYKDAYEIFRKLALDRKNDPKKVGEDLNMGRACLQSLGRVNEIDEFREGVIKVHGDNWRLLMSAAQTYTSVPSYGYMVAGEFYRGDHRGGGRYVNTFERDRIRALQLMDQALKKAKDEKDTNAVADLYLRFADMLISYRGYQQAWRLQYLSDLSKLPDYEDGYGRYYYGGRQSMGAPVDEEGNPVFHKIPESYETAKSDGECWRWLLLQAMELSPNLRNEVLTRFASFLHQQFGVQTMSGYVGLFQRQDDDESKDESGTYDLHTLGEDETIAKLANGIKRFKLPAEFSFIHIYQQIADEPKTGHGEQALNTLAQIFENRRQYDKAADYWKRSIKEYGAGHDAWKQKKVDQILGNWGQFEPVMTQPAGKGATLEYKFRNGTKVTFEAHEIHVEALLADVKAYLKSNPNKLEWDKINIGNIGYCLVQGKGDKYIGDKVASWDLKLEPRKMHFNNRITVATSLQKPGAYWLTARMNDGNTSHIIIWLDDTVIVKKQLDKGMYCFVADSVTGKPVAKANVEFFGYWQEYIHKEHGRGDYTIHTTDFAEFTDTDGQVILKKDKVPNNYQWIISATTPDGRFAYLGFSGIWFSDYYDREYNETKVYAITDRPVYRPKQAVKFKFWVRHAKYDQEDTSSFANQSFTLRINNPKGDKVFEKTFTTDAYGGFDGEYMLPKDTTLGQYYICASQGDKTWGGGYFRVEEYKKPEFEVKIEAPTEPVMLGEKIAATIKAEYYFGGPVTKAKVRYKILRSDHSADWYPVGIWDWFYGPGYWWFAYDYMWYPHWHEWGCKRPHCWWWPVSRTPPEVVAETEVNIGEDGIVKVEIDTAPAKELHGDTDHRYEITAEVTDESRRTIVGQGAVLVACKPFKVYAWVDRGHYRVGDVIRADFSAQTLDNKPVKGNGELNLYRISYPTSFRSLVADPLPRDGAESGLRQTSKDNKPVESSAQKWNLNTDDEGQAHIQLKASEAGQYRLSYKVTDTKNHTIEGGYMFCIVGQGFDGKEFRFNEIELVPDKKEYAPGEKVNLMVNTDRPGGTVVLFVRPANGIYLPPKIVSLEGKSMVEAIEVTKKDMPNFFVEAFTISNGKMYEDTREIIVPPEKRVLNVEVIPSAKSYKPGEKASVNIQLTDFFNKPFVGSAVVSIYDKSVEYISGGSNVQEIRQFFWKWRRAHHPRTESTLSRCFGNLVKPNALSMQNLGVFGHLIADEFAEAKGLGQGYGADRRELRKQRDAFSMEMLAENAAPGAPMRAAMKMEADGMMDKEQVGSGGGGGAAEPQVVQPVVRTKFADTAFWAGALTTDADGTAKIELTMPENLTGWKIRTWAMGHGTKVGEGTAEVVTAKKLMLRLQAPRFFVEKDEVVLSANIHNYLQNEKAVKAILELDGPSLKPMDEITRTVAVKANGEQRVDWRVKVVEEGEAVVRMKALTDEESDAMEMRFPVYVHGMLKMDSFSGVIRPDKQTAAITINVPKERRIDQSRLEARYSPTLAGAMVDALPYLVSYPYGCTEQTLNRFLPSVIVQKVLINMGLDLKDIKEKRANLNAQEIGDDKERAEQWKRWDHNPVFDQEELDDMVKEGLKALTEMQLSDGGWGWFSGWGEQSYPHTTAYVVHGLQVARGNDVAIVPGVLERGVKWLENYQQKQVNMIKNAPKQIDPWKEHADNLDAFVFMVLVDAGIEDKDMLEFLYRDRNELSVYAKAMYGIALHKQQHKEKLEMIMSNIEQFLVQDDENQSAWLNLQNGSCWWYWYGSEYEAHAYYLKLLARTDPKSEKASRLVKYLLNNRKHATYWNSTRDTALCIEAMAEYLKASGEDKPDMVVEIYVDGKKQKEVQINTANLFTFDNKFVLHGDAVEDGKHKVEFRKKGAGPLYFNAYLTNFTLEDYITRAGLEIKVNRKYYKLNKIDEKIKVRGSRGQALDQKVEKYERNELLNLASLKSGDLVEIELVIESKNDYEYIVFEDMKAAGFEPVEVRSGYNSNDMGAYMELRDERVCFFARALARGKHSVSYRMRAEIPGKFSALPTRAYAMYAPELKGNSDEIKLSITD